MSDFMAKMHHIRFRLGSDPDPAGGAYSGYVTVFQLALIPVV